VQHRSLPRSLFILSLATLLLLPVQWSTLAASARPLMQHIAPLQPSFETHPASIQHPTGTATETTLYPSDDAPVQEGAPSSPDPSNLYLGAGRYNGSTPWASGRVRSYIRFNLSSIPSGSTIVEATLRLYHAGGGDYPGQSRTLTLYRVTGSWSESTVTWNNRPSYADSIGSFSTVYNFLGWRELDLTTQTRNWVDGSHSNYGFVVIGPESTSGVYRALASSESTYSPELVIRYVPPVNPVLDAWPGTLPVQASSARPLAVSSFAVSNVTRGTLDWDASKVGSATWLTLDDTSGSATPTTPDSLGLTVDASGLAVGTYTEQIRITSDTPDVAGSPITVTVSLEVLDQLSSVYLPLVVGGGGNPSPSRPEIVALIIGISDYQHLGPAPDAGELPDTWGYDLANPHLDRDDMKILLEQDLGVAQENIYEYCGGPGETAPPMTGETGLNAVAACSLATRANVVAGFVQLDSMEDKDTTVIIYYSGHGGQTPDTSGDEADGYDEFIAMYDTNTSPGGFVNVLTDDDLDGLLADLESEHIVVILDSCFSGSMMDTLAMQRAGDLQPRGLVHPTIAPRMDASAESQAALSELVGPGRLIITGGTGDQTTWESDTLQNGVFTYYYLEGLQDGLNDANQDGIISTEEAYWFSKDLVDEWVFTSQGMHQNPDIADQYHGQMELVWLP
jgi:hypothetical protein